MSPVISTFTLFEYKFTATSAAGSYTLTRSITLPRLSFTVQESFPINSSVRSFTGTITVTSFISVSCASESIIIDVIFASSSLGL